MERVKRFVLRRRGLFLALAFFLSTLPAFIQAWFYAGPLGPPIAKWLREQGMIPEETPLWIYLWISVPIGVVVAGVVLDWIRRTNDPAEATAERDREQQREAERRVRELLPVLPKRRYDFLISLVRGPKELEAGDRDCKALLTEDLIEIFTPGSEVFTSVMRLNPEYRTIIEEHVRREGHDT